MRHIHHKIFIFCCIASVIFVAGCYHKSAPKEVLFKVLDNSATGINFSNTLHYNQAFNLFKYIYFYNGSGVGAGDFNNDGLVDLFFGSNQQQNKLFLNKGHLQFKDATQQARIPQNGGWTTGISVVDINNDGLLDIYICQVGNYEILHSKNQLLINQGIDQNGNPIFIDKATEYGLDFSGFSTQAAFFDYDLDGDLDMFLLNHSVHENGTFRPRKDFEGTSFALSGDRIYRNDGATFTNVTLASGINSTAISYGLGIAIADINLDGYPDIYIGNDFHENDYLYINQKNGTFKEEGEQQLMHTSQYSMGVDVADVNNDAYPEIFSVDMLPADPYILKRSLGEDAYDIFNYKLSVGYSHQYTRNNFQFNRKNNCFSEVGLQSGIAATDWSWAPLWMDFNNDGLKDLFITNGIPKRMNDIDYINFVTDGDIQKMIKDNNMSGKNLALINKFPEIKLYNKFFTNNGDLSFTDEAARIEGDQLSFSNGAAYADLDNDGDLDVIANNIDAPAMIYENKHQKKTGPTSLRINLKGPEKNINAVGARVIVFANKGIRTYEKFPVRGFMSSMEQSLLIGLENTTIDSMVLVWPDNTFQALSVGSAASLSVNYQKGFALFNYSSIKGAGKFSTKPMEDITKATALQYLQEENHFNEFDREPLMPHMLSTEGPALAVADINHDGLEDVFIGGARDKQSAIFLQTNSGKFIQVHQLALAQDSIYEDVAATWADVNHDGNVDLIVASGGNEFYGRDAHNSPRVYLNDGKGNLTKKLDAFHQLYLTASSVAPYDFNGDGFTDLFISGRGLPWEYGLVPQSYLLQNDGTGKFIDVTQQYCPALAKAGFVTQAQWCDMDKDGDKDLLLSLEWGGITVYRNDKNVFTKKILTDKNGWWNNVLPVDIDNDGDIDLIAGNLGLNSRLKASVEQPVRMYYNDFDGNGKKEQVLTYYLGGKQIPFANKAELEKQMPMLKKQFLYAADFAKATLPELFTADKLNKATVLKADYFANAVLINQGDFNFEVRALPTEAQFSSGKAAVVINANNDGLPDILFMGNYYDNNIEMGRYDADFGSILINKGKGNFEVQPINGLTVKGQVRQIASINIGKKTAFILARNSDSLKVIGFAPPQTKALKKP